MQGGYGYPPYQAPPVVDAYPFGIDPMWIWMIVGAGIAIALFVMIATQFLRNFLYIARPNEALIFSGKRSRTDAGRR